MQTHTGCHYSALPQLSCVDALTASIGKVSTNLHYERKAWDAGRCAGGCGGGKCELDTFVTPDERSRGL